MHSGSELPGVNAAVFMDARFAVSCTGSLKTLNVVGFRLKHLEACFQEYPARCVCASMSVYERRGREGD